MNSKLTRIYKGIGQVSLVIFLLFVISVAAKQGNYLLFQDDEIIIDSRYLFEEIFADESIPKNVRKNLKLVEVEYFTFDVKLHRGQILIHKDLVEDIVQIFKMIKEKNFPIDKVVPINRYNWSDELSMQDNNTSAFNYRFVKGTNKLSPHALGRAIDINPMLNPQIKKGKTIPAKAHYDIKVNGTITSNSFLVKEFTKRGWKWGGFWKSHKDYQHFEKVF